MITFQTIVCLLAGVALACAALHFDMSPPVVVVIGVTFGLVAGWYFDRMERRG